MIGAAESIGSLVFLAFVVLFLIAFVPMLFKGIFTAIFDRIDRWRDGW